MNKILRMEIIAACRKREADGDCTIIKRSSPLLLEQTILDLSGDYDDLVIEAERLSKDLLDAFKTLADAQREIEQLKAIIAGVAFYLEGDPTFNNADRVLDEVDKIATEYYQQQSTDF